MHNIPAAPDKQLPHDLFGRADCARKHDVASYIWLVYSVFFFIEPIFRNTRTYWLHQLPFYFVFLGLYIGYVHFEQRLPRLCFVAAIFLLGVLTTPSNTGGSSFFIYVAALLPFCIESQAILIGAVVVQIATLALENHLFPGNPFNYLITGFFTVVVGISNVFVAQSKRADARLRSAQAENVELAAVAERERIARDLHDVLGHTLSVIVLKAELASRLLDRGTPDETTRAAAEIADVERTARAALAEVREAIGGYRSKGLSAELEQARLTLAAAGVALTCETRPPSLKSREETVLSLAVREAVTNIVRHAHATACTMRFTTTPDGFTALEVHDNGSRAVETTREGNGLRGMRERVQELGGRFHIEAGGDANLGTRLVIELPRSAFRILGGEAG